MRQATKDKVFSAVRNCLDRCYRANDPLVQATEFIDRLRYDPGWSQREIVEVETMVLTAVRVIVRQPRRDCCGERTNGGPTARSAIR